VAVIAGSAASDNRSVGPDPELRSALLADRAGTANRIAALTADLEAIVEASRLVATDDEHDPEGATIAFERSQTTTFLEDAHKHLADLDSALDRLEADDFGRCEICGNPIAAGRLIARPTARTCIDCAT
jgi:RNA polymerase-binding transcription factor DksA